MRSPLAEGLEAGGLQATEAYGRLAQQQQNAAQAQRLMSAQASMMKDLSDLDLEFERDQDWKTLPDRYEARVSEIGKRYRDELKDDPSVLTAFNRDFQRQMLQGRVKMRGVAVKKQTEAGRADLDMTLDTYGEMLGQTDDESKRAHIIGMANAAIGGLEASGVIGPEDAFKRRKSFISRSAEARVMADARRDPEVTVRKLLSGTEYSGLDPVKRESMIRTVQSIADTKERQAAAAADRAERLAEKAIKQRQEQVSKDMWDRVAAGELTLGDVRARKNDLSESDFRALITATTKETSARDDQNVLIDLETRVAREDIGPDLALALDSGFIRPETYSRLMEKNRSALRDDQPASPYKTGREFIRNSLDPGDIVGGSPGAALPFKQAQARAMADFDTWAENNPGFGPEAAREKAQEIVSRYSIINAAEMKPSLIRPRGFTGAHRQVTQEAVQAGRDEVLRLLDLGQISKAEAARELQQYDIWDEVLSRDATKPPASASKGAK